MDGTILRALTGTREHPELVFRRRYRASVAQLREACTDVERLGRWFGRVEGDPTAVGDRFVARLSEDEADVAQGRVLRCADDEIAVAWSWQGEPESVITVRAEAVADGGAELVLRHALGGAGHAVGYGGGWEQTLGALARALADPGAPEPADDAALEAAAAFRWRTIARAPLELERLVPALPARVWAALASADGLAAWWWRHWDDVGIEADVRVGGRYRFAAPGAGIAVDGVYLAVEPPSRLAFSWCWRDDDGASVDEAVDVRLVAEGAGTRVHVRHSGPWEDDAPATSYRHGWELVLGELAAVVG